MNKSISMGKFALRLLGMSNIALLMLANSLSAQTPTSSEQLTPIPLTSEPKATELVNLRDEYSRTYQEGSGSFIKYQSYGPMHYKKNDLWLPFVDEISLKSGKSGVYTLDKTGLPIELNTKSGETNMQLDENGEKIIFGKNTLLELIDAEGKIISSEIMGIRNIDAEDNKLTYIDAWKNIDRTHNIHFWQVETDYIIKEKPTTNIRGGKMLFKETFTLPEGWTVKKGSGTKTELGWQGELLIINRKGKEKGKLNTPVYYEGLRVVSSNSELTKNDNLTDKRKTDLTNDKGDTFITGAYQYSVSSNLLTLSTIVPADWLLAENRQYPLTIDPNVTNTYSAGSIASCWAGGTPDFNYVTKNVFTANGATVTRTNNSWTYVAWNGAWLSDVFTYIGGNTGGYVGENCNTNSSGSCSQYTIQYCDPGDPAFNCWRIANGTYANGIVPVEIGLTTFFGNGCNTTYAYIPNNTWLTTIYYNVCTPSPSSISTLSNSTIWIGSFDDNWENPDNWTDGVPTATVNAYIPSCGTNPRIYGNVECRTVTIFSDNGAQLNWNGGSSAILNVRDSF